jgi:ubiquinone/menaquinone biosynthesis C-methylase UbiE/uncharacterized protein YbaR (Trm112 family)
MRIEDIRRLACPSCRGPLDVEESHRGESVAARPLRCSRCRALWPVSGGLLRLYREEQVKSTDRLMRVIYNALPSLHDPATRLLLPLMQGGGSEPVMRDKYMRRIDLGSLIPRRDGQPARILEIGVGAGANLPLIQRDLPPDLDAEIWGLDLSEGMLRQCQAALARSPSRPLLSARNRKIRLLMADAHALPFQDHTFDRVFHVGAMGSYRDPRTALAEMARVAIPGTPIVVVDEQLDPSHPHSLYRRTAFRLLTFYDRNPHCPTELLPPGAAITIEEQLGRFYYCLTFTIPPNLLCPIARKSNA